MTIREIIDVTLDGEELTDQLAEECVFAIVGPLRTLAHGKPSDFESDCVGMLGFVQAYGKPTAESFRRFIEQCPKILEIEISNEIIAEWVNHND